MKHVPNLNPRIFSLPYHQLAKKTWQLITNFGVFTIIDVRMFGTILYLFGIVYQRNRRSD